MKDFRKKGLKKLWWAAGLLTEGEGTRVTIRMARYNEQEKKVFGQD